MNTIHQLSDEIIAKIAAGETIERPSFAIKELIDNALDANASDIRVDVTDNGLTRITVQDNGIGMSAEDLRRSFLLHTTSKIQDIADLYRVSTLGFRGEALASIAGVSQLTIESKQEQDPLGSQIEVHQGVFTSSSTVGMPTGTRVIVDNLFSFHPARKKFLSSNKTELRFITDIVIRFALSYPLVRFLLRHNKRTILDLPFGQTMMDRLTTIYEMHSSDQFFPIHSFDSYLSISGALSHPQVTSTGATKQFLFVNNRSVSDRLLTTAVREAYGTLVDSTNHPIFILSIQIPFELVDVNVHPRKEQIQFVSPQFVFNTVKEMVRLTLGEYNLTFSPLTLLSKNRLPLTQSLAGRILKKHVVPKKKIKKEKIIQVIQFDRIYLLAITSDHIFLLDQHAAHERVLFEQFQSSLLKKYQNTVALDTPLEFLLPITELQIVDEYRDEFKKIGFHLQVKQKKVCITHIPEFFKDRDLKQMIQDFITELEADGRLKKFDSLTYRMLTFLACRSAIKAGEPLGKKEAINLVDQLFNTPNQTTCPHGRPTMVTLTRGELDVLFKRR